MFFFYRPSDEQLRRVKERRLHLERLRDKSLSLEERRYEDLWLARSSEELAENTGRPYLAVSHLMRAARHYRRANELKKAARVYKELIKDWRYDVWIEGRTEEKARARLNRIKNTFKGRTKNFLTGIERRAA